MTFLEKSLLSFLVHERNLSRNSNACVSKLYHFFLPLLLCEVFYLSLVSYLLLYNLEGFIKCPIFIAWI
jgi:hypothetical protein